MPGKMISRVRNMVASGQVEFLYYLHNDPGFVNNINVYVSNPLRSDLDQIEGPLCSNLQSQLRQSYQRSENVRVYGCERKKLYNIDSISSAFDGVLAGSRSYSFLFNSNSGTINLTITCKLARCREVFSDSATLFKNMRF